MSSGICQNDTLETGTGRDSLDRAESKDPAAGLPLAGFRDPVRLADARIPDLYSPSLALGPSRLCRAARRLIYGYRDRVTTPAPSNLRCTGVPVAPLAHLGRVTKEGPPSAATLHDHRTIRHGSAGVKRRGAGENGERVAFGVRIVYGESMAGLWRAAGAWY